jgi:ketosteroid isomerase-like protein
MHQALHVVQQAYQAYARRDLPAILELIAPQVDWEFVGSAALCRTATDPQGDR